MKLPKIALGIFSLFYSFCLFAQRPAVDMKQNKFFFNQFNNVQIDLIKKHWEQYFTEDIYPQIYTVSNLDYCPVFIDSYGGVYPESPIYQSLNKKEIIKGTKSDLSLNRYSHYHVFKQHKKLFEELSSKTGFDSTGIKFDYSNSDINRFYTEWDNSILNNTINKLNKKLIGKKNILFFIHGYNVPYSLAVVQSMNMLNQLKQQGLDLNTTLFVPIFWSSNNAKRKNIGINEKFSTKNFFTLENYQKGQHYSNRAYYAAITLRKILNSIPKQDSINVMIVAHSMGTLIATSSCINTISKLDFSAKKGSPISEDICIKMESNPEPKIAIKMFLSAAGIPGVNTFTDIDSLSFNNKIIFSTINTKDEILTKRFLRASKHNSTTLGCNYKGETYKTEAFFLFKNSGKFIYKEVSRRKDHDIFTYLRQPSYIDFLKEFLNYPKVIH